MAPTRRASVTTQSARILPVRNPLRRRAGPRSPTPPPLGSIDSMTFDADDAGTRLPEREILDWDTYHRAARQLAGDVLSSGFVPEVVIAIARGGLLLAGSISYALGTKNCGS